MLKQVASSINHVIANNFIDNVSQFTFIESFLTDHKVILFVAGETFTPKSKKFWA